MDVEAGTAAADGGGLATGADDWGSDVPFVDGEIAVAAVPTTIVEDEEEAPATTTTTHLHRTTTTTTAAKRAESTTSTTKPKTATTTTTHVHRTASTEPERSTTTTAEPEKRQQTGLASWYDEAEAGYCAHRTLPKGTKVWVYAVNTGKEITCVVNDRGPYIDGRIIDLSREDFSKLTDEINGLVEVRLSW